MTTTTTRFRLPAVFLALAALIAVSVVVATPGARASHRPSVSISDGYRSQPPPLPSDCPCPEGDSNTTINFDVSLSSPADETITVDYTTSDGSAVAGQDFVAESGTVTFSPGPVARQTISIEIVGDDVVEENIEDFLVFLFNVSSTGQMGDQKGVGEIADDDEPPTAVPAISIDDQTVAENAGPMEFTVSLDQTSTEDIQVQASTSDGSATFIPGNDYERTSQCLTISAGEETATFDVTINNDGDYEPDEDLFVDLSRSLGCDGGEANIADNQGEGTITNDDPTPARTVSVEDTAQFEGDSGTTDFEVTFTLSGESDDDVTVEWETRDGTATDADNDYEPTTGSVTIPSGETSATDIVPVNGDTKMEDDETLFVLITSQENASVDDGTGEVTIRTDEPSLTISDGFAEEPDEDTNGMSFTVRLSQAADWTVAVDYATKDGTATAGEDYEAADGTLEFEPGDTSETLVIDVNADSEDEDSETFFVDLSNAEGAGVDKRRGEGLIGGPVAADAGPNKSGESAAAVSFKGGASGGSGDYTFTWDFGDDTATKTGVTVTHHFPQTGTFNVALTVKDNANDDTSTDTATVTITDSGQVNRSSASERIGTAIDVSADHWNRADTVLLATAYNYPDALAAGPLSKQLDAPLLLTGTGDDVPDPVKAELDRLDAEKVIILGGAQAVSQAQSDELAASGYQIQRIADVSRFGTAADISVEVGPTANNEVTVALGAHADPNQTIWADSLSAGSFAALPDPLPALLTHSDFVPQETLDALEQLATEKVFLLGGSRAISPAVEAQLEAEGYDVQRVAGQNRFETSVEAGKIAMSRYPAGQAHPVFATGSNYPDGLTSGALAGKLIGPVVLVTPESLDDIPGTRQFLRSEVNRFDVGTIVGGDRVVSENVRTQAASDIDAS